ncbi:MAG: hypothetical protein U0Q07_16475 [Acidimicrobiales bacterium]
MARISTRPPVADDVVYDGPSPEARDAWNLALRVIGGVAGAVPFIIGLIAVVRLDWGQGFDAPPVEVAGMPFTVGVALATVVAGLFALVAGASWDRESKLVVGAILICLGIAVFLAGPSTGRLVVIDRHGWMAVLVGGVLVAVGLLLRPVRRVVAPTSW